MQAEAERRKRERQGWGAEEGGREGEEILKENFLKHSNYPTIIHLYEVQHISR